MVIYESAFMQIPRKRMFETVGEREVAILDELINMRAKDGWELVTHCLSSGSEDSYYYIIATFKKEG